MMLGTGRRQEQGQGHTAGSQQAGSQTQQQQQQRQGKEENVGAFFEAKKQEENFAVVEAKTQVCVCVWVHTRYISVC